MADDGSTKDATWPTAKFHFNVQIGQQGSLTFQEVSGLDAETQPIEYRPGDSRQFSTIKMPGIKKYGNITMKKGIFKGDKALWDKFNEIKLGALHRVPVTIQLCDENGNPTMVWTLANAWPTKITSPDMNAEANEVAIET